MLSTRVSRELSTLLLISLAFFHEWSLSNAFNVKRICFRKLCILCSKFGCHWAAKSSRSLEKLNFWWRSVSVLLYETLLHYRSHGSGSGVLVPCSYCAMKLANQFQVWRGLSTWLFVQPKRPASSVGLWHYAPRILPWRRVYKLESIEQDYSRHKGGRHPAFGIWRLGCI
jgi:hypothetical protein